MDLVQTWSIRYAFGFPGAGIVRLERDAESEDAMSAFFPGLAAASEAEEFGSSVIIGFNGADVGVINESELVDALRGAAEGAPLTEHFEEWPGDENASDPLYDAYQLAFDDETEVISHMIAPGPALLKPLRACSASQSTELTEALEAANRENAAMQDLFQAAKAELVDQIGLLQQQRDDQLARLAKYDAALKDRDGRVPLSVGTAIGFVLGKVIGL